MPRTWRRSEGGELAGSAEDGVEHGFRQLAGEGVLLADVEAADDPSAVAEVDLDAVREGRPGTDAEDAAQALVREGPEGDHHAGVEQGQLALEVRAAGVALVDCG